MLAESDVSKHGSPGLPDGERRLCLLRQWQLDWRVDSGDITGSLKSLLQRCSCGTGRSGLQPHGIFLPFKGVGTNGGWGRARWERVGGSWSRSLTLGDIRCFSHCPLGQHWMLCPLLLGSLGFGVRQTCVNSGSGSSSIKEPNLPKPLFHHL